MSLPQAIQDMADYTQAVEAAPQEDVVEEVVEQPVEQPRADAPEVWEQRYKSFKGHADAELRRMQQTVAEATARANDLDAKLREVYAHLSEKHEQEAYPQVTSAEVDTFGQDMIAVQEKIARRVMLDAQKVWAAERNALLGRIEELQNHVGEVSYSTAKSEKQRFFDRLSASVPDWEVVNQDTQFHAWLAQEDQFSGLQRQQLLNLAGERNDVGRVAAIFNAFKASTSNPEKPNSQRELEKQVSPSKQRGGATVTPIHSADSKKIWTSDELQTFYSGVARGKITPEQAKKTESEIHKAVAEGRVR